MSVLTDEQQEAVDRRSEPLLLAAGAGSGKTSVLVERFVRAVRDDGIAPGRIMAITFTDRAAGELRVRVRDRLLELGEREAARDTEAAFISTFHGFCARLLRGHALTAGLDPRFAILEEAFAGRMRERAFAAALADFLADGARTEPLDVVAAYGADRLRTMILGIHDELRSRGQRRPRLPGAGSAAAQGGEEAKGAQAAQSGEEAERRARSVCLLLGELLERFATRYEDLKREQGAVDFDDLELLARDLLERRESVRRGLSERFELLMVDEFQDTNPRQLAILAQLERENLFTVGDEMQSIYGFRHADVRLFRDRRRELEGRGQSLALTQNFRSLPAILDVVNAVFGERFGEAHMPLVAAREEGTQREPLVELLLSGTAGWKSEEAREDGVPEHWRRAEAQALAERVGELIANGDAQPGEVVVLLRSANDLDIYEDALRRCGLNTLASVGAYWERLEVGDLLAYLRALANPLDELALLGTLACPLVGVSGDGLALLAAHAHGSGRGVWETIAALGHAQIDRLAEPDRRALEGFGAHFSEERPMASRRTLSQLIERAMQLSDYGERLLALEWGERRLANLHKLIRLARRFEATSGRDLRGFLDHVAYRQNSRVSSEPDAPAAGKPLDAIQLMTIHAAKGLEFPVVCVADLGRKPNLTMPELLVDGDRIGLRLMGLDGEDTVSTLAFDELWAERRREKTAEEERIIYVAMTRARERLLLSGAVAFQNWPLGERAPALGWLGPALSEDLPKMVAEAEHGVIDLALAGDRPATVRLRMNTADARRARAVESQRDRDLTTIAAEPPAGAQATEPAQLQLTLDAGEAPTRARDAPADPDRGSPTRARDAPADPDRGTTAGLGPTGELGPLSYTALSELERCGYRYYLERMLGLGEERAGAGERPGGRGASDEMQARARGTLVHSLLEDVDFRGGRALSPQDVGRAAKELGMRVAGPEREEIAALVSSVSSGAASGLEPAERVAAAASIHREHPFAFSLGTDQPLLTGVIDLLAREHDGGVLLLDYKSDRVGEEADLEALVERDYGLQRLLYALAVLRDGAPSVEVIHWFLRRPRDWVGARYLAAERPALEERLRERVQRALSDPFTVSRAPHRGLCLTCPGRARLCSWTDDQTLREDPQDVLPKDVRDASATPLEPAGG